MDKHDKVFLIDILEAAQSTQEFIAGCSKSSFMTDKMCKSAVVHEIEIMGEATKQLSTEFRDSHKQIEWRSIAAMRDRLIHGYNLIDYEIVWSTVMDDIPEIIAHLRRLIG